MNFTTLLDVAVYTLTLGGFLLVPEGTFPRPLWPLVLGIWHLAIVAARTARERTLPKIELGRLWAGVLFATLGVALFLDGRRPVLAFAASLGAAFAVATIWSGWNAWKEGQGDKDSSPDG